jgi:hypothetical protein
MKAGSCLRVGRLARVSPFRTDHLTNPTLSIRDSPPNHNAVAVFVHLKLDIHSAYPGYLVE